jgi:hypothetical protein
MSAFFEPPAAPAPPPPPPPIPSGAAAPAPPPGAAAPAPPGAAAPAAPPSGAAASAVDFSRLPRLSKDHPQVKHHTHPRRYAPSSRPTARPRVHFYPARTRVHRLRSLLR